ncbi:MAG: hypothetical protein ABL964_13970 [Steroidobacteraceae bacterium]
MPSGMHPINEQASIVTDRAVVARVQLLIVMPGAGNCGTSQAP